MSGNQNILFGTTCPDKIWEGAGNSFVLGGFFGTFYWMYRGYRDAPANHRMAMVGNYLKTKPILTAGTCDIDLLTNLIGSFASYAALFNTFKCGMLPIYGKEDKYANMFAGFCTAVLLRARFGPRVALTDGVVALAIFGIMG